jgi:hypothetical protein
MNHRNSLRMFGCPSSLVAAIKMTMSRFPFWSCGDLVFSGHTVELVLSACIWTSYCKSRFLRLLAIATALLGVTSLLGCRYHYSIDVFTALLLSYLVWSAYPYLLNFSDNRAPFVFSAAARCVQYLNGCKSQRVLAAEAHDYERQPLVSPSLLI